MGQINEIFKGDWWQWFFSGIGNPLLNILFVMLIPGGWFWHSQKKRTGAKTKATGAKNKSDKAAAPSFIAILTPLLIFIIVLSYIQANPATEPKSLWEAIIVILVAIAAAAAVSVIVTKTYTAVKTWVIFLILIPVLSMMASVASAWYILGKPSFVDLVKPLVLCRSELSPSKDTPIKPSEPEKGVSEPGKDAVDRQPSDMPKKSGDTSELESGIEQGTTGKADLTEPRPGPGKIPGTVPEGFHISDDFGMKFVYIPPGTFMMGSSENEPGRDRDETLHRVTLTRGFYMQTTEVTQGQWKEVMGENPSRFKECGDDCPVETVSWDDVQEFIKSLNRKGEGLYRLPTEAEWEYAARAGSETAYCFGNDAADLGKYAWYGESWDGGTHPVAQKQPNAWGLYDMHGNVWEWCHDWYGKYPSDTVTDPTGSESGSDRVNRCGSFLNTARYCRSANRGNWRPPGFRGGYLGFRLVREAP